MRRKWMVIVIVIFLLVAGGAILYLSEKTSPAFKGETTKTLNSVALKKTIIAPHMEQEVIKGKNIVYCSTIQLAWNELKNGVVKEDIRMTDEPPMVKVLNRGLATKEDLSEKDYVAMAGFGKDNIIENINKELTKKFKDEATPVEGIPPDSVMMYSFLYKNLEFEETFKPSIMSFYSKGKIFNIESRVKAFGLVSYDEKLLKQVDILYYPNGSELNDISDKNSTFWKRLCSVCPEITEYINFVVRLKTKTPDDEIILAKIKPEHTLQKTIEAVQELIKNRKPEEMNPLDILSIPNIFFDIEHNYKPLLGKHWQNRGFTKYSIEKAIQKIVFSLNEKGALLKSSFEGPAPSPIPRQLVFDRPFLIYLKKKDGKWPYFVMWVDNPELMENYTQINP